MDEANGLLPDDKLTIFCEVSLSVVAFVMRSYLLFSFFQKSERKNQQWLNLHYKTALSFFLLEIFEMEIMFISLFVCFSWKGHFVLHLLVVWSISQLFV